MSDKIIKIDINQERAKYDSKIRKEELDTKKELEYLTDTHLIEILGDKVNEIIEVLNNKIVL